MLLDRRSIVLVRAGSTASLSKAIQTASGGRVVPKASQSRKPMTFRAKEARRERPINDGSPTSKLEAYNSRQLGSESPLDFVGTDSLSTPFSNEPFLPLPLAACVALGFAGVLAGVASNENTKYVRLVTQEGCTSSWKDIGTPVPGELKCCADHRLWDSVCASNYRMEAALSTLWGAWLLPLSPLIVGWAERAFTARNSRSLWKGGFGWTRRRRVRLGGYLVLMLFRTLVLYYCLNIFEDWWAEATNNAPDKQVECDYAHLTKRGQCKGAWNAADHVVLLLTHHVAIAGSELSVLFAKATNPLQLIRSPSFSSPTSVASMPSQMEAHAASTHPSSANPFHFTGESNPFHLTGEGNHQRKGRAPFEDLGGGLGTFSILCSIVVCASATYCVRQTAALFHVPSESAAALTLSIASILAWRSAITWCERRFGP